jgi:hypothetical protein
MVSVAGGREHRSWSQFVCVGQGAFFRLSPIFMGLADRTYRLWAHLLVVEIIAKEFGLLRKIWYMHHKPEHYSASGFRFGSARWQFYSLFDVVLITPASAIIIHDF